MLFHCRRIITTIMLATRILLMLVVGGFFLMAFSLALYVGRLFIRHSGFMCRGYVSLPATCRNVTARRLF